jgi:hypothetical protein
VPSPTNWPMFRIRTRQRQPEDRARPCLRQWLEELPNLFQRLNVQARGLPFYVTEPHERSVVTAEALLPDGPYDLWREGEKSRRLKDLVGAFALSPQLPKMLNRSAILDTLVLGCKEGQFVLRAVRPDRSVRTFWRQEPDEAAIKDPGLEVMDYARGTQQPACRRDRFGKCPDFLLNSSPRASIWLRNRVAPAFYCCTLPLAMPSGDLTKIYKICKHVS